MDTTVGNTFCKARFAGRLVRGLGHGARDDALERRQGAGEHKELSAQLVDFEAQRRDEQHVRTRSRSVGGVMGSEECVVAKKANTYSRILPPLAKPTAYRGGRRGGSTRALDIAMSSAWLNCEAGR